MTKSLKDFLCLYWFIIIIILAAAFLRFFHLESTLMFLGDQGRDALVLKRMLIDHNLPFIGPITSVGGFYLGPLYYYLMAPFLFLSRFNPVGPAIATAFLGVITLPAVYFVSSKMFNKTTAYWSSLLYAVAFIPISETRSAWNPNPMPLAALGILYGLYLVNYKQKPAGLILASASLAIALQLHYMIVFLAPLLIWQFIAIIRSSKSRKKIPLALAVFLLIMSPLILFEIKNNFLNFRGLIEFFTKNQYNHLSFLQIIKDLNGRAEQAVGMILGFGRDFNLLRTWITRLFLVVLIYLTLRLKNSRLYLLVFWLFSSIAVLAIYHSNVYPHYLGFLFPIVFILTGFILSTFKNVFLIITISFLFLFSTQNLPQVQKLLSQTGNLKNIRQTSQLIISDINKNHHLRVNLALLDDTRDYRASSYRYFVELKTPNLLKFDQYPETQILYVISPYHQPEILKAPQWEIQALSPAEMIDKWEYPDSDKIYKIKRL